MAVYTGSSIDVLDLVTCVPGYGGGVFQATAGTTYRIQVGRAFEGSLTFSLTLPAPPSAGFFASPWDPSAFDTVFFQDTSYDPAGATWTSAWTFGDGSSSTESWPSHRYASDGTYHVTLTITTSDGRSSTAGQDVLVRTHDVSIKRLTAPASATSRQTKQITVGVVNTRYAETVEVQLYASTAYGWVQVGSIVKNVPMLTANRTTDFSFDYRFSKDDAAAGKVSFRAVVVLWGGVHDALPGDNEAITTTKVTR